MSCIDIRVCMNLINAGNVGSSHVRISGKFNIISSINTICPITERGATVRIWNTYPCRLYDAAHISDTLDAVQLWSWYAPSSHEGTSIFPHIKDILCGCITAKQVARQQSLISNALFLTFATMCYYKKGLDFPGMTFRPWVRYTVSTLHVANGDLYLFCLDIKKRQSGR